MGKSDLLKEGLKGGLNGLLTPTSTAKKEEKKATGTAAEKQPKEKAVHCNFVIDGTNSLNEFAPFDIKKEKRVLSF